MNQSATDKKFAFNDKIDSSYLFSLYEDDYGYILEVFTDSIEELENGMMAFAIAFNGGQIADLKSAAHKMKPLFGFTGLLAMQEAVAHFEEHCSRASEVKVVSGQYNSLLEQINDAKQVLISEQQRLQDYSAR